MSWLSDSLSSIASTAAVTVTRQLDAAVTTALGEFARRLGLNVGYQHVLLGDIAFDLITCFEGAEESFGGEYVEHGLMGGKPRLQCVGDKLNEIKWSIVLHAGFCDPELEVLKLRDACARHEALPLVYANGDYRGQFVPVDGSVSTRQTMRDGTLIWVEASLSLKEYVRPPELVEQVASQPALARTKTNGQQPAKAGKHTVKHRAASKRATRAGR